MLRGEVRQRWISASNVVPVAALNLRLQRPPIGACVMRHIWHANLIVAVTPDVIHVQCSRPDHQYMAAFIDPLRQRPASMPRSNPAIFRLWKT